MSTKFICKYSPKIFTEDRAEHKEEAIFVNFAFLSEAGVKNLQNNLSIFHQHIPDKGAHGRLGRRQGGMLFEFGNVNFIPFARQIIRGGR